MLLFTSQGHLLQAVVFMQGLDPEICLLGRLEQSFIWEQSFIVTGVVSTGQVDLLL